MAVDFYGYVPSLGATILFIVLFAATTAHHLWVVATLKCLYFIPFLIGGLFQVGGYSMRVYSGQHRSELGPYAVEQCLIILPPSLYAASIYMTLGRLLIYIDGTKAAIINVKWMTKIFVVGDVLSFLLQGGGAGLQGSGSNSKLGSKMVLLGLAVQIIFFALFVVTTVVADIRLRKMRHNPVTPGKYQWRILLCVLHISSFLILFRSLYRAAEYAMALNGSNSVMSHEVYMYVFDAVPMLGVMVLFNVVHPAFVIRRHLPERIALLRQNDKDCWQTTV